MNSVFNFKKILSIVLSILIVAQTASSGVSALNVRAGAVRQQVATITIESAMLGFGGDISQSFLDNLGNLVGDDMTIAGLVGFNLLMADALISESALRGISRSLIPPRRSRTSASPSRLDSKRMALIAMSQIVSQGKMTIEALRSISAMFDNEKLSPLGLTRLASLYRQNNIHYVGMLVDEQEEDNSDGVDRKYASTIFPGCEENDIIFNGKVWAACNASYYGMGNNETPYELTYDGQDSEATDENGWKYGNLYQKNTVSCPIGYRKIVQGDIESVDLSFFNTLKIPLGGYKKCTEMELHSSIFSNGQSCIEYNFRGKGDFVGYMINLNGDNKIISIGYGFEPTIKTFRPKVAGYLRCLRITPPTDEELQAAEYKRNSMLRCEEDERTISRYDSNGEKTSRKTICSIGCNDEPRCLTPGDLEEEEYNKSAERRCEEDRKHISRYDSNGERSGPLTTCSRGCNDEPRCLVESEVEEEYNKSAERRCEEDRKHISRYDSNGERSGPFTTCTRGCNDQPRCLMESEVEEEGEYIRDSELRCEEDGHTISRYDSNGEKTSTKYGCSLGCNDEPRCLTQEDLEEEDDTPTYDEYVQSKVTEINQCHIDLYNSQLEELEDTIDDFQESVRDANAANNNGKALKYIKAIEKLEQIQQMIATKYRSVFGIE